jgi:hypothetical protein
MTTPMTTAVSSTATMQTENVMGKSLNSGAHEFL